MKINTQGIIKHNPHPMGLINGARKSAVDAVVIVDQLPAYFVSEIIRDAEERLALGIEGRKSMKHSSAKTKGQVDELISEAQAALETLVAYFHAHLA